MQAARRVVDEVKLRAIGLTATGHRNTAITVAHGIQGSDLTVSDNAREGIVEKHHLQAELRAERGYLGRLRERLTLRSGAAAAGRTRRRSRWRRA